MKCCFCKKEIKGYGNNAEPIRKGECCDECNRKFVIPTRLASMKRYYEQKKNEEN